MTDPTEAKRREWVNELNSDPPQTREEAEKRWGKVWDTSELSSDFTVMGFMAPFVVVTRKSDGKKGTLAFTHMPRWYFGWQGQED